MMKLPFPTITRLADSCTGRKARKFRFAPPALVLPVVLLMTSGCASIEVRERRQLDAVLTTAKGAPLVKLTRELALLGYTCSSPDEIALGKIVSQCSKQRDNVFPPYACIFRVDLQAGATEVSNETSTVLTTACAGL